MAEVANKDTTGNLGTIYLVEDEAPVRYLISEILKSNGYGVVSFESGEKICEYINQSSHELIRPKLIILDLLLPGISGVEALKFIRSVEKLSDISVVMLTSYSKDDMIKKAFVLGAYDYLLKPIAPERLIQRVKSNLSLDIEINDLQSLLNNLHFEEQNLVYEPGLKKYAKTNTKFYPILFKEVPLCFVVPGEYRPKSLAKSPEDVLTATITVYRRNSVRWVQIWPKLRYQSLLEEEVGKSAPNPSGEGRFISDSDKSSTSLILSLHPCISEDIQALKRNVFGKLYSMETTLFKSLVKWSEDKTACEAEVQFWKEKINLLKEKVIS